MLRIYWRWERLLCRAGCHQMFSRLMSSPCGTECYVPRQSTNLNR